MAADNFNINTWIANGIPNGGVLSSLFEVSLPLPSGVTAGNTTLAKFQCRASSLPGDALEQVETTFMGRTIQLPGNRAPTTWAVTCMADTDWNIRNAMEEWMELISGREDNIRKGGAGSSFFSSLTSTMSVKMIDRSGERTSFGTNAGYSFFRAWPSELAAIELDWGTNEIANFDITFSYAYWKAELPG